MNNLLRLFVAILIFTSGAYAQCPENIGFESGLFTNWESYGGEILPDGSINVGNPGPLATRHEIMKASDEELDEFGHFPTVSPNGSKYSVKLGNSGGNHQAERLSYTLTVPADRQYILILNYALVLQNPTSANHSAKDQPRFTVTVFNVTDNTPVSCPAFDFVAASNLPGFKVSDITPPGRDVAAVFYKDWTATTIDLSLYGGKQIKIEFTTNDCTFNAHFGYAYFDINENCQEAITGNIICENQTSMKLQGPKGFKNYKWYLDGDMQNVVGTEQTLKLSPVPPVGTTYVLKVAAATGLGCSGEFRTSVVRLGDSFVFKVKPVAYFCPGTVFNLTSPEITQGSVDGLTFEYYTNDVTQEYLRNPDKLTEAGVYYIKGTNAGGCTDILRIELKFYDAVSISSTDPAPVQYPARVDLAATYTGDPAYQYFYYSDAKLTKLVADFTNISASGKYFIKAINKYGCEKTVAVNVLITPPPPNIISGPTAITPNGDGINDMFNITIKGFVDFGTLKIFNRIGEFLFQTKNQSNGWDGNFKGRSLPVGTYYWLFEGVDQYYHTKINKGGYVSIIK